MPLLRYELGDAAEFDPAPCPCGRGLPVLKRILGRVQEMLRLPGGEARWPLLSAKDLAALLAAAPIRQYQIAQRAPDEIELRLVTARPLDAGEEDALRRWMRRKFAYPFAVSLAYFDDLPLARGGKFPDFVVDFRR
jgi:phenylacetate-CoA ligase